MAEMSSNDDDIVNMARLALQLAQIFASGPTAAIHEFTEVRTNLFALKYSLDSLGFEYRRRIAAFAEQAGQDALSYMLEDCRQTLMRIVVILERYTDKDDKKWIFKNWFGRGFKFVAWTTEGGDLKVLKEDIQRHSQIMTYFLSILNE